jgi:hypothetical protein
LSRIFNPSPLGEGRLVVLVACRRDPVALDCGRFEAHATTVVDRTTHFVWQRTTSSAEMDWAAADAHCRSIGMLLPTSLALSEILPLDACAFPDADAGSAMYWSATEQRIPVVGKFIGADSDAMVAVNGHEGFSAEARTSKHRVRCWNSR